MFRCAARLVLCVCLCGALFGAGSSGVWLNVPFVKQEKNGCGAACIAMVMQYWQRHQWNLSGADAKQIQRALYSRHAHGIYASAMQRYFQQHGFRTVAFHGEWEDLKENLEKGRPLIVALKTAHDSLHYVVVAGLDWRQGVVLKNDPAKRKLLRQERSDFEKEWKAVGNWTLLAVPCQAGRSPSH